MAGTVRSWPMPGRPRLAARPCPETCPQLGRSDPSQPDRTRPKSLLVPSACAPRASYGTEGQRFESSRARSSRPSNLRGFAVERGWLLVEVRVEHPHSGDLVERKVV